MGRKTQIDPYQPPTRPQLARPRYRPAPITGILGPLLACATDLGATALDHFYDDPQFLANAQVFELGFGFISMVLWLHWTHWVATSAQALAPNYPFRHTPLAAVFWYIIPLANFLVPYFVMKEILASAGVERWGLLRVWWLLWLTATITGLAWHEGPLLALSLVIGVATTAVDIVFARFVGELQAKNARAAG